jgi:hypothetical protein
MVLVLAAAPACSTPGASLRAEPNVICPGDPVTLTWTATDSATITADPPGASGLGDVPLTGARKVSPSVTTTYTLTVRHYFKQNSSQASVDVRPDLPGSKRIGQSVSDPSADCDSSSVWVTAIAPANFWSPRLLVGRIASSDGRSYRVEHGGKSADIDPAHPSDLLRNLPVAGPWKLSTTLKSGEACHHNVPNTLAIDVFGVCGP